MNKLDLSEAQVTDLRQRGAQVTDLRQLEHTTSRTLPSSTILFTALFQFY